ncbi:hypothetical protein, partial [Pseudomonas quasicaspiana]|uniref:hypothetical protein n=1 Tax=Pseudomonas quasicaspiana TaxID=2829821 RepID=UPI001E656657
SNSRYSLERGLPAKASVRLKRKSQAYPGNWQLYGTYLAAYAALSGNDLPLFCHPSCRSALQPFETGHFLSWHADCYVSIKKIWSTGKGFPK